MWAGEERKFTKEVDTKISLNGTSEGKRQNNVNEVQASFLHIPVLDKTQTYPEMTTICHPQK